MAGRLHVEPATPADARVLGASFCVDDLAKVLAVGYSDGTAALLHSLEVSALAFSAFIDDELVAIFGVMKHDGAAQPPKSARVWMMSGPRLLRHPKTLFRASRAIIKLFLEEYPFLDCWIHERSTGTLRWVRWLGFSLDGPHSYGPKGAPFFHCTLERRS